MHRILQRQIKKYLGDINHIPPEWIPFLDTISRTYFDFDKDYELLSRSLELSSQEFSDNNRLLSEAKLGVEKTVQERTVELENIKKVLEDKNKSLEAALNANNDFIRIANHQLNTPLSIMKNAYAMVSDGSLTPKQGLEYWGGGLKKMIRVVEDFWNVLQLNSGIKYDIKKNNIGLIVKEAVSESKEVIVISKKDIKIIIKKPDFVIPPVLCDGKKISSAIYNLLDNAVFYTKKGTITIFYELIGGKFVKVNIKDTGIGFSPADKEKISQKFYRSKNALLSHPDGSGLGLYIVRNIIESNGGKLFYESGGEGLGATFSFTLPCA